MQRRPWWAHQDLALATLPLPQAVACLQHIATLPRHERLNVGMVLEWDTPPEWVAVKRGYAVIGFDRLLPYCTMTSYSLADPNYVPLRRISEWMNGVGMEPARVMPEFTTDADFAGLLADAEAMFGSTLGSGDTGGTGAGGQAHVRIINTANDVAWGTRYDTQREDGTWPPCTFDGSMTAKAELHHVLATITAATTATAAAM